MIGIIGCLHGNEKIGAEVIQLLKTVRETEPFLFILGNETAMKRKVRYVDRDLNRCFPGNANGNHEEKLALEILHELRNCELVIDIHSTTTDTENFVIVTKDISFTRFVPLHKVVVMDSCIASGKALIDHVPGISLEFNRNTSAEEVKNIILETVKNFREGNTVDQETYLAYGILEKGNMGLANFKQITINDETFYPVLAGENEYKFTCMKAHKK